MKIVIVGGTGLVGAKLVRELGDRGHETIVASPSTGVDAVTGVGLAGALAGADAVVDVTNAPSPQDEAVLEFFETSTGNLLAAEAAEDVGRHVVLSVVGADRLPDSGYMRAKVAQETLVRAADVPFTIVRATQFFEFLGAIAAAATDGNTVRLPPALAQPIAADDVAAALADIALGAPVNGTVTFAGPERFRLAGLVRRFLNALEDPRQVTTDDDARYFGAKLDERSLLPDGDARLGPTSLEDWLAHGSPGASYMETA